MMKFEELASIADVAGRRARAELTGDSDTGLEDHHFFTGVKEALMWASGSGTTEAMLQLVKLAQYEDSVAGGWCVVLDTDEGQHHPLPYAFLLTPDGEWEQPVVLADAFRNWVDSWRIADPNGRWGEVRTTEVGMTHIPNDVGVDGDPDEWDVFPQIGTDQDGNALYAIRGWTFVKYEEGQQ